MKTIQSIRSARHLLLLGALAAVSTASCAASRECCETEKTLAATTTAPASYAQGDVVQLPEGWTEEDMQACMIAGTPGDMHEHLAQSTGIWEGKTQMWMGEGSEPMVSECTMEHAMIMDGRYAKSKFTGEMPGMGAFNGLGFAGYDNVEQKFVSCWLDNHSTKIMVGEGELSDDGKTMTWRYEFTCPVAKKLTTMREIERMTGPDTKTWEMHMVDPKTGREYKAMQIDLTRKSGGKADAKKGS